MINTSTGIGFSLSSGSVVEDNRWIWMDQVLNPDTATKKEVADLIDTLFEMDPCVSEEEETPSDPVEPPTEEEFQQIVQKQFSFDMCYVDGASNYKALVRVYRSHFTVPYTIRLTNGQVNTTTVKSEEVEGSIVVDEKSGIVLEYPISKKASSVTIKWNTTPVGKDGIRSVLPITRTGNALNWGKDVTGTIYYKYTTEYEELDVTVFGDDDFNVGECLAIAFYDGVYYELELQPPDDTTEEELTLKEKFCNKNIQFHVKDKPYTFKCYKHVYEQYYCQCSDKEVYYTEHDEDVDCPGGMTTSDPEAADKRIFLYDEFRVGGFVRCEGEEDIANDPDFYLEKCCDPPPFGLPRCKTVSSLDKATTSGRLSAETRKRYTDAYNKVEFIPVWPENGICGELTVAQEVRAWDCCDVLPTTVQIDRDTAPEVLPAGGSATVYASGGKLPYTWRAGNNDTFVNGGRTATTDVPWVTLSSNTDFCGVTSLNIEDGCDSDSLIIRSDQGEWIAIGGRDRNFGEDDKPWINEWGSPCVVSGSVSYDGGSPLEFAGDHQATFEITSGRYKQVEGIQGMQINDQDDICNFSPPISCTELMSISTPLDEDFCMSVSVTWDVDYSCEDKYGFRITGFQCWGNWDVHKTKVYQMISFSQKAYEWRC